MRKREVDMNEPLMNPGQQLESYQPHKPEMMRALEEAQAQGQASQGKGLVENILHGVSQKPSGEFEGITHFPKYLKVVSDYLGDELDYTYAIVACGGAFRLGWDTAEWNCDIGAIQNTYGDAEATFRNGVAALGREFKMLWREGNEWGQPGNGTKEDFKAFIKKQIDQGHPLISLGPVGPPEAGIITGYRDGGDTLLGWSGFQGIAELWPRQTFSDEGYFVTDAWWDGKGGHIQAVMSLGDITGPRADAKWIVRNAIAALEGRQEGSVAKGVAAYDAWKKALLGASKSDFGKGCPLANTTS